MSSIELTFPVTDRSVLLSLHAGDPVTLSGVIYTARDQAHKRLMELKARGEALPLDLNGTAIYYCGPTPAREDRRFGSAGPTTSARMDPFAPEMYALGAAASIGKGGRSEAVRAACEKNRSVYLITFGGAGAYLAKRILTQELVAFPDLGAEAIYRLTVKDFPAIVGIDAHGKVFTPVP